MSQQHHSASAAEVITPDRIVTPGRALEGGTATHEGMARAALDMAGTGFWGQGKRDNPHKDDCELAQAWDFGYEQFQAAMADQTVVAPDGQIVSGQLGH